MQRVSVVKKVLSANDRLAEANRARLVQAGLFALNLLASPGAGTLVTGNTIRTYHRGIFHNLQYQNATAATISNNTITAETSGDFPASSTNFGIELASIQSAVSATVTDNDVSNMVYGI